MIRITTDVFCDVCGDWIHGVVDSKQKPEQARKTAKNHGWIVKIKNGRKIDLCPKHHGQDDG